MNLAQAHLLLNHFPSVGMIVGLVGGTCTRSGISLETRDSGVYHVGGLRTAPCQLRGSVKNFCRNAVVAAAHALFAALLLTPAGGLGQENEQAKSKSAKAKRDAKYFENYATVITLYDGEGKKVGTVGERAIYGDTILSPDRTRVAVVKFDQEAENADLWMIRYVV
jgi:hypothetical protein